MQDQLDREVSVSLAFLSANIDRFVDTHAGRFALLRDGQVHAFYNRPIDAYREGVRRFPDRVFTVEQITPGADF